MELDSFRFDEVFPWRIDQKSRLLIDGTQFFPDMLQAIDSASSHVLLEMYIMESGQVATQFIDAFVRAAKRNVTVQLLIDGFGSRGLLREDRRRLEDGGVQLAVFNPLRFEIFGRKLKHNLFRTHRKFLIVDGTSVHVGGAGISDAFIGKRAWHDCMVEVSGSTAADWQALFDHNMRRWSSVAAAPEPLVVTRKEGGVARLSHTSGGVRLPLKKILLNRIRRGKDCVWLASAYFIPSGKIRRALRRAAVRGKDVRLLLPGPVTDHPSVRHASRRYYARLLRHGVRIFEYEKHFMHSKVVLVDDWCTIGSSNMDRWNFRCNLEANQEAEDSALAKDVKKMLSADFENSKEIHYEVWLRRSWLQHLKEWLWGTVDRWLTR